MNYIKLILIGFTLSCCCSCASYSKKDFKHTYVRLNKKTVTQLNGTYKTIALPKKNITSKLNGTSNLFPQKNLYFELLHYYTKQYATTDTNLYSKPEYKLKLTIETKKSIRLSLYKEQQLVADTLLHGKLKKGMFYITDRYLSCHGVPYLFGGCTLEKHRLALAKNGNLIVNEGYDSSGAILFILASGHSFSFSNEFERIE